MLSSMPRLYCDVQLAAQLREVVSHPMNVPSAFTGVAVEK
jgi:hypothetical protein